MNLIPITVSLPTDINISFLPVVEKIICTEYGILCGELKNKTRKREYVISRQFCMFWIMKHTKSSLSSAGMHYNKDHATVMHSVKTINNLLDTSANFREKHNRIYHKIHKEYFKGYHHSYVCIHCGMMAIRVYLQVNPNSMTVLDELHGDNFPGYCLDCQRETVIIQEHEYKKHYQHEPELDLETISNKV